MGLFDRLFGQEENQSQETVANQEFSETDLLQFLVTGFLLSL